MNKYSEVNKMLNDWKSRGLEKTEIVVRCAEACMGWPYIWGAAGQQCTPSTRRAYSDRSSCPTAEAEQIRKLCQVVREKNPKSSCIGCKWYPDGTTLAFDCRGFTRWVLGRVGISLIGAGATSQWNTASNWSAKGEVANIPEKVCCVFMRKGSTMSHTGFYVGGGRVIHCSGEVKEGKIKDKGWTHWAVPKGLEGGIPVWRPTIRKGSKGDDVKYCQELLIKLGYDVGSSGADGKFGNKTREAVMAFQRDKGLNADGGVGPLTWDALEAALPDGSLYTVSIPHLTKFKAEALVQQYAGSSMTKEE